MDRETFDKLPIAALLTREGIVVAANPAYEALMAIPATALVGRVVKEIVSERLASPDADMASRAATARYEGRVNEGTMWCRVIDGHGKPRALRVMWCPCAQDPGMLTVFVLDDGGATEAKDVAEALARAGSELTAARDEREVLERAAEALAANGFTVTFLLIEGDDPLLVYGPSASPVKKSENPSFETQRLPRELLTQLNPRFHEGRAVFLQELRHRLDQVYDETIARDIEAKRPGRFVMQAPLFVSGVPYGAMVLTSDKLSPALAAAAEIFAALVVRAIENVRMRADLVAHERLAAIGEAAAVMAHEVRNPVGALLNAVALLRRGEGDAQELLSIVTDEAHSLERIVSDLLALGRPITPRVGSHDLRALASRAIDVARSRHTRAAIRLHGRETFASVDPDLVQIAVYNVVRNAVQASPDGAPIDVFVEALDVGSLVRVDDRGPGIPAALSRRVFEPFFTTRPAGTGIGLAAVRRIVEACGGRVEVGSNDEGGGRVSLTFRV